MVRTGSRVRAERGTRSLHRPRNRATRAAACVRGAPRARPSGRRRQKVLGSSAQKVWTTAHFDGRPAARRTYAQSRGCSGRHKSKDCSWHHHPTQTTTRMPFSRPPCEISAQPSSPRVKHDTSISVRKIGISCSRRCGSRWQTRRTRFGGANRRGGHACGDDARRTIHCGRGWAPWMAPLKRRR